MAPVKQFFLSALAAVVALGSAVVDLTPDNFDAVVLNSGKPALVEFFAPWCGHCKNLAPIYEELAETFAHATSKVTIAKVDADEHKELGRRFGVQGFPTLKWFDGKSDKPTDYKSGRDIESLSSFITENSGVKAKGKKAAFSNVKMLTDSTFGEHIGKGKNALIAFTAPWCGHCKNLAPTWESLANTFANEEEVLIVKVDADSPGSKTTAAKYGVSSYPTLKYIPAGSLEAEDYDGGRTESDFINFINSKVGTHRTPGGGLDASAGTIDALNHIVYRIQSGEAIDTLSKEAVKVAEGLKDVYAKYYVKVFEKLGKNQEYVVKELKRLENIVKKGGFTPQKADDLWSRINILRLFSEKPDSPKEEL